MYNDRQVLNPYITDLLDRDCIMPRFLRIRISVLLLYNAKLQQLQVTNDKTSVIINSQVQSKKYLSLAS